MDMNIKEESFTALFAPDGSWQPMATATNMAESIAVIEMLSDFGLATAYPELIKHGFKILPVKITITVTGTEEDAFKEMKDSLK